MNRGLVVLNLYRKRPDHDNYSACLVLSTSSPHSLYFTQPVDRTGLTCMRALQKCYALLRVPRPCRESLLLKRKSLHARRSQLCREGCWRNSTFLFLFRFCERRPTDHFIKRL